LSEQLSCERRIWASDRAPASFAGMNARREHPQLRKFTISIYPIQYLAAIRSVFLRLFRPAAFFF